MARNKYDVDESLETEFNIEHLKRLWTYVRPHKKDIIKTLLMVILTNIAILMGPYLLRYAINVLIPAGEILKLVIVAFVYLISIVISRYA